MKAEIIAIGTELLLGQIVNTNAQYLANACAAQGIDVYYQTVVGDNESRLAETFRLAKTRADVIICTGGLGPTQDDLTKDVLASLLSCSLHMHQPTLDKVAQLFQSRGLTMVASNDRQALLLEGCEPLTNETGLAIGVAITQDHTHYILLPGPPKEMKPMFDTYAIPWLRRKMTDTLPLFSKMLKFAGIGESNLEHELIDLIKNQTDPTIAPYAKEGEVTIRLSTKAATQAIANDKFQQIEQEIRHRVGQYIYADRDIPIESVIIEMLIDRQLKLAVVESCSGGKLSDMLTSISGSSSCFEGGMICYSYQMKHQFLDIPMHQLEGEEAVGAVSQEVAVGLAQQLLHKLQVDYALSITGVAGPNTVENKPVGLVYVGIAQKNKEPIVHQLSLSGNRESIKLRASKSALYYLWHILKNKQ